MKKILIVAAAAGLVSLAACNQTAEAPAANDTATNVTEMGDNMDAMGDAMTNGADAMGDTAAPVDANTTADANSAM